MATGRYEKKVAWVNPENAKAGKDIGVALNDTAHKVLREQTGKHQRYVFVHSRPGYCHAGSVKAPGRKCGLMTAEPGRLV